MSNGDPDAAPCTPPGALKGVQVVYRDENGNLQCKWLNLNAIDGITWCPGDPPNRPPKPPKRPLPTVPNGPDLSDCVKSTGVGGDNGDNGDEEEGDDDSPLCWWTGSSWECGTA